MDQILHATNPAHYTKTGLRERPIAGIFVHNTEAPSGDAFAYPHEGGSWHTEIDRDGVIHRFVGDADVAHTVRACDRWHPFWLPRVRPWNASAANCWGLHLEFASNKKFRDQGRPYTQAQYASGREVIAEWRKRYGPLPVIGHGLVQADRTDPVRLDWRQLQDNLSLWPLKGTARVDPTQGGWGFLDWTGDTFHPGVDFNAGGACDADAGAGVVAPVGLTVRHSGWHITSTGRGFGWHVWAEADTGHWLHFCHLQAPATAVPGAYVPRGAVFGLCGKTAGWDCAHVHFEVAHARPAGWGQWPQGWSKAAVEAAYIDPFAYLAAVAVTVSSIEEEPMPILTEAQLVAVQAGAWGEQLFNPDFAIPKAWRLEVQAGRHPGRPVTEEQSLGDGVVVQWFETGRFAVYVPGQPVSWNG